MRIMKISKMYWFIVDAMTEETQFFFDCIENSTELYREAQNSENFYLRSFFEEPTSNDLFIEVDVSSEDEDSLFRVQETF